MKESAYKDYDELPLLLNTVTVANEVFPGK